MDGPSIEQIQLDQFELLGLKKEKQGGIQFYTFNFKEQRPSDQSLSQLKEILKSHRVAVEIGPGDQIDSLMLASRKADADVVIGIDPYFNFDKIKPPDTRPLPEKMPKIILLKGVTFWRL